MFLKKYIYGNEKDPYKAKLIQLVFEYFQNAPVHSLQKNGNFHIEEFVLGPCILEYDTKNNPGQKLTLQNKELFFSNKHGSYHFRILSDDQVDLIVSAENLN